MSDMHLARLKKGENTFEVVVDPDLAMEFRKNKEISLREVLKNDKVWFDAKKGQEASHEKLQALFETDDTDTIVKEIILKGDIQLSTEYRERKRQEKYNSVVSLIQRHGVDPKTKIPHPRNRVEAALEEARVKIDEHQSAEEQIQGILRKLQPILPIKFVTKKIEIHLLAEFANKVYGTLMGFGKIVQEEWQSDGGWKGVIEIPGGLEPELYETLSKKCHCEVQTRVIETR
ncbi:MAG: ribosome assembly factor SBDS [Candidatus Woesearchaeota archaeon]